MRKQILLFTTLLLISIGLNAQFAGGNGSAKFPFQVATAAQLDEVRNYRSSTYNFIVTADIDLTTYLKSGGGYSKWGASGWLPIGGVGGHFDGNFNGNGHNISGLWINRKSDNFVGLFGYIYENGMVNNLNLIIGKTELIKGNNDVGGVCGHLYRGTISNCHITGGIYGEACIGGIAGVNSRGIIQNCSASTEVTGDSCVGSLTGYVYYATVLNSFSKGTIIGNNYVGGLTGSCKAGTIQNCYSHADVSQSGNTNINFGGFAGHNNSGEIVNCYSTGWVKFDGVTQTNRGFLGTVNTGAGYEMSGNFWDKTTSGATTSAGIATAKSTAQMTTGALTYPNIYINADWDFKGAGAEDIWNIGNGRNDGYPYFDWQYSSDPAFALFAGGVGTSVEPFQIKTASHLNNVRNYLGSVHSDKHFILVNDIDLTTYLTTGGEGFTEWGAEGWMAIGDSDNRFNGKLDGNNHIINGLWINRPEDFYVGLFGIIDLQGEIIDLGIEVSLGEIVDGSEDVGILAGVNSGSVHDCYATGEVNGNNYVGGLIGFCQTGSLIEGCSFSGLVTGIGSVGGLTGAVFYGIAEKCYSTGEVYGEYNIGGLTGAIKSGTIRNSYSLINIILTSNEFPSVGGFIGKNEKGSISKCYSTGRVTFGTEIQLNKGFCGSVDPSGDDYEMTGNFWDIQTSGATTTGGAVNEYASGKTTFQMKKQSTFVGWDFGSIWSIVSEGDTLSYPFLTNNVQIPAPGLEKLFAGGDGSEGNPYQITTPAHLNNVRNYLGTIHVDKYFRLLNDIDLTDYLATGDGFSVWGTKGWLPIGNNITEGKFHGKFNGYGHAISGLWINRPDENYVALFGFLGGAGMILNLGVEIAESLSVTGQQHVSVIASKNEGNISFCYANGDIESTSAFLSYSGLIVGYNDQDIRYCYANGTVNGGAHSGGFAGVNSFSGLINNCYAHVNVTRNSEATDTILGAFIGLNDKGYLSNNYSIGWVKFGEEIQARKGFCGSVEPLGDDYEMTGNYWDIQTSGASSTGGAVNQYASGKTTLQMKQQSTFTGWDFDNTWSIVTETEVVSYPFLSDNVQIPEPGLESLFTEGDGSETNPFHITTPAHLNNIRYFLGESHAKKNFKLMNDIDLTDYLATGDGFTAWGAAGWLPIGKSHFAPVFCGKLNGNGFKISGLWINRPSEGPVALFVYLGGGEITNLGVETDENSAVIGNSELSVLVAINNGTIENCYAIGEVISTSMFFSSAGIFVGNNIGTIRNCFALGAISGNRELGGFVGANNNCAITSNCFAHVNVTYLGNTSWPEVGAFAGTNSGGKLINNYSTGWVKYGEVIKTDKGFCGNISSDPCLEMSGNFWDMQTSGSNTSTCNATGKTTVEMKTYSTFIDGGWDFMDEDPNGTEDVWGINRTANSGYPFLYWQGYENNPANELRDNLQMCDLNITGTEPVCFNARDTITVAGGGSTVVVGSTSSVELIAGHSIRFLPGFRAIEGSFVNASITTDGTFCDGVSGSPIVDRPKDKSIEKKSAPEKQIVIPGEKSIKVYPNPNNGQFTLELTNIENGTPIYIYNMLGVRIYQTVTMNQSQKINLPDIKSGIYFVKAVDGKEPLGKKIIVNL